MIVHLSANAPFTSAAAKVRGVLPVLSLFQDSSRAKNLEKNAVPM